MSAALQTMCGRQPHTRQAGTKWNKGGNDIEKTTVVSIILNGKEIGHGKVTNDWIHSLFVKRKYRHKGVGTQILKELIKLGGKKLFVKKKNKNAIRLYEKIGFVIFANDERRGYLDMIIKDEFEKCDNRQQCGNG